MVSQNNEPRINRTSDHNTIIIAFEWSGPTLSVLVCVPNSHNFRSKLGRVFFLYPIYPPTTEAGRW